MLHSNKIICCPFQNIEIKNGRQISNFLRCTTKLNKTIFINIVQTRNETRGDEKVYAAFS